jgi:general transcription factor IIIA
MYGATLERYTVLSICQSYLPYMIVILIAQKPFSCDFEGCDKSFKRKDQLMRHIRSHTGEKNHVCGKDGCGRAFITAAQLQRHINVHGSVHAYVCDLCDESFHKKTQLRTHKSNSHGVAEFQCSECIAIFR